MLAPERIVAALDRLDPEDRAHLELSYRRGFSDAEIADLVGAAPEDVPGLRDEAVAELADELGAAEDDVRVTLEAMDEDEWAGRPREDLAAEDEEPEDEDEAEVARHGAARPATAISEPATTVSPRRSRRVVGLLLAGAAVLLLALIVALASGGDGDGGGGGKGDGDRTGSKRADGKDGGTKTQPGGDTPPPAGGSRPIPMERLNGTYGRGTARILGEAKLRLRVSGFLRPTGGGYAVWLIGPGDRERRLYATTDTTINRDFPLPANYKSYEFVEIARAVPSLDSPHSTFSLLRVRVKALATGGL